MSEDCIALAAASRAGHLAMRRVERQQALIEMLDGIRGQTTIADLARRLGVSMRTVARDVDRLVAAGMPIETRRGREGGVWLARRRGGGELTLRLDIGEAAALVSSLAVTGTTGSLSAASAMRKLREALRGDQDG